VLLHFFARIAEPCTALQEGKYGHFYDLFPAQDSPRMALFGVRNRPTVPERGCYLGFPKYAKVRRIARIPCFSLPMTDDNQNGISALVPRDRSTTDRHPRRVNGSTFPSSAYSGTERLTRFQRPCADSQNVQCALPFSVSF